MASVARPAGRRPVLWPAIVAVAPLVAAFGLAAIVVGGWVVGVHPFWPTPEVTLSEAAATRDAGELYRLLVYEGHDPNRPWRVRAGMLSSVEAQVTPLEAAVATGRPEIVGLLLEHGASVGDAAVRTALICRAATVGDTSVLEVLLATGDGSDPRTTCALSPDR